MSENLGIDPEFLGDYFGVKLNNIKVVSLDPSHPSKEMRRSYSSGDSIYLTDTALNIAAHEIAHALQKNKGKETGNPHAPLEEIEHEARDAERSIIKGSSVKIQLSDSYNSKRFYEQVGHYYTVYLIYLNHGFTSKEAQRFAFSAWMPDRVAEFDAYSLFKKYWRRSHLATRFIESAGNSKVVKVLEKHLLNEQSYMETIHKGLHVLTGGGC